MTTPPTIGRDSYTLPFHGDSDRAALLFHDLTSTPSEMESLAILLGRAGFSVHVPRLPGHGFTVDELRTISVEVFLDAAERAYEEAAKLNPAGTVFVVGSSFGALLALHVAAVGGWKVKGCVVLSLPWTLRSIQVERILRLLSYLPEWALNLFGTIDKPDRRNKQFTNPLLRYSQHSIGAVARIFKMQRRLSTAMEHITARIIAISDPNDHCLAHDSVADFQGAFPANKVEVEFVPDGEHELLLGPKATTVEGRIVHFADSAYSQKPPTKWDPPQYL